MKICTADFPDEPSRYHAAIDVIARHVEEQKPDMLVLPEMPFTPWVFYTEKFDRSIWDKAVSNHSEWLDRFAKDVSAPLISSRPVDVDGERLNQAIYMSADRAIHPLRSKFYLPNEYPAIEVPWFDRGDIPGEVFDINGHRIGVQLCSEIMYAETPRLLGANGAQIIIQARATGNAPRWRAASVLAAATSGAFVIGANRHSVERDWFTGCSWVYSPDGVLLTETSADSPIRTVEIDLNSTMNAKSQYPLTMFEMYHQGNLP